MLTIVLVVLVVALAVAFGVQTKRQLRAERQFQTAENSFYGALSHSENLAAICKYLMKQYHLDGPNPYVYAPAFNENRCYHCRFPQIAGYHDKNCPWVKLAPVASEMFKWKGMKFNDEGRVVGEANRAVGGRDVSSDTGVGASADVSGCQEPSTGDGERAVNDGENAG